MKNSNIQKNNKPYSNSMNNDFDIETIRRRADIVSVVGRYVTLRRQGRNLVGLCPFHDDHHPSLTVNAEKGLFHCFSCGSGGDIFDFVQQFERCGFHEAARIVASICGIPTSIGERHRQSPSAPRAVPPQRTSAGEPLRASDTPRQASVEQATFQPTVALNEDFARMLRPYKPEDDALADAYARFGVGLAPEQGIQSCYAFTRGRLVFPIVSHDGRLVAFAARSMAHDDGSRREPKYINSPNSTLYCKGRILYGFHQAKQRMIVTSEVYLVEGYKDCLAMHAAGFANTVAICGTSLTDDHIETLRRVVDRVFMMLDTDEAGRTVTASLMPRLHAAGIEVRDIMSKAHPVRDCRMPDTETAKGANGVASDVGGTENKPTDGMKDPDEMFRRLGCSVFANEVRTRSLDRERRYIEQLLITAFILWPDTQCVVRESLNELLVAAVRRELEDSGRTRFDKPAVGVLDSLLKEQGEQDEAGTVKGDAAGEGLPATEDTGGTEEPVSAVGVLDSLLKEQGEQDEAGTVKGNAVGEGLPATKDTGGTEEPVSAVGVLDSLLKEQGEQDEAGTVKGNAVGEGLPATEDTSGTEEPVSAGRGGGESSSVGRAGDMASPDRVGEKKPEWMFDAEGLVSKFGDELYRIYDFFSNVFMTEAARRSRITMMLLYTYLEPLVSTELMAAVTHLTDNPANAAAGTGTLTADGNEAAGTDTVVDAGMVADANNVSDSEAVVDKSEVADANESDTFGDYRKVQELLIYLHDISEYLKRVA